MSSVSPSRAAASSRPSALLDGYGAVRMIRSSARADAAGIPIYAMTANTFAEDVAKAREAGMNGHIAKPLDIGTLMHVLRKELN